MIPRWIKDYNLSESVESRIEGIIYALVNNKTKHEVEFISDRELIGWTLSELMSILNKIRDNH